MAIFYRYVTVFLAKEKMLCCPEQPTHLKNVELKELSVKKEHIRLGVFWRKNCRKCIQILWAHTTKWFAYHGLSEPARQKK